MYVQQKAIDASAHVHRHISKPDRLRGHFHHSARIILVSQLDNTSRGKVSAQPCALHKLLAPDATGTATNPGGDGNDASRRDQ